MYDDFVQVCVWGKPSWLSLTPKDKPSYKQEFNKKNDTGKRAEYLEFSNETLDNRLENITVIFWVSVGVGFL